MLHSVKNKTVGTLLTWAKEQIEAQPDLCFHQPSLESKILLEHVIDKSTTWMITHPEHCLDDNDIETFVTLVKERLKGRPIAYIIKKQYFWDIELEVSECTLIPRQDTEVLIEAVLALDFHESQTVSVVDLGTGTGAIAIVLAKERPKWRIEALDCIDEAVLLAQRNAHKNGVNVNVRQSNWFEVFESSMEAGEAEENKFELIVANPPYVESGSPYLRQGDLRFEPDSALSSGTDGLDDIRHIIDKAPSYLKDMGYLFLEHGHEQHESIVKLMKDRGFINIGGQKDYNDKIRVSFAQFRQSSHE